MAAQNLPNIVCNNSVINIMINHEARIDLGLGKIFELETVANSHQSLRTKL
jgi:hypothetical protein